MSKLTDLINQISSEIAQTRISNEEFKLIMQMMLEIRIEVRQLESKLNSLSNTFTITGGASTNIAVDWPNANSTYNTSDVVV